MCSSAQRKYVEDLVRKYGLEGGKAVSTPFESGVVLGMKDSPKTDEEMEMARYP